MNTWHHYSIKTRVTTMASAVMALVCASATLLLLLAAPQPPLYASAAVLAGLIGGSLLLITATALGTYWMMGKTLQPVRAISGKLATIRPSNLSERVPLPRHDDEFKELAQTTNQTLERAQTAIQEQLRFASDASHDLRNPLAAIHAEIEDALMQPEETDWVGTGDRLLESVERLQDLVTNLLEISRLDAGIIGQHDLLNLAVLVDGELDHRQRDHRQSKIRVVRRFSSGVMVNGERIGLERLLQNLMDNAERHARSTVTVTVEHRGDAAVLEVHDDGCGVPPEQREVVFQRFVRLQDARAKDAGGSGLGLPIARQIAEAHGGTLAIEDSPSGARFVARFPRPVALPASSR
ncbi:HAMP domain-containing sensor histidine kinase [Microtetraspora sp. NBRC 16547]|uniref:sensor histidine kinase n=1 Tax=Microtetraspora sp. NBRC 16547 TaxID=3030993 RepID=UPI002552FE77|nr:HAMP domain-containing sensor histidine kinase [Microtetraspora sp. NBRC 16547]